MCTLMSFQKVLGYNLERLMIENLASHGLVPTDLTAGLIQDAKKALEQTQNQSIGVKEQPMDIRYTIVSHLFLLSISDGFYDARARTMLRRIANNLEIAWIEVVQLETYVANELRIYDDSEDIKHDANVVGERNRLDGSHRWLYAGLATVAGGAIIGVTAGLAAPFIGAGIGAALTTFGVTGTAGIGTFMASAGGVALITSGGVLTGGGIHS